MAEGQLGGGLNIHSFSIPYQIQLVYQNPTLTPSLPALLGHLQSKSNAYAPEAIMMMPVVAKGHKEPSTVSRISFPF